jgi:predicted ABC-type transport system involved in lysophospholipase L1 biosynthesis ATPase subunit
MLLRNTCRSKVHSDRNSNVRVCVGLGDRVQYYPENPSGGDRVQYYPENPSGGQKQRVAIAKALLTQLKILVADEPTAELGRRSTKSALISMKRICS